VGAETIKGAGHDSSGGSATGGGGGVGALGVLVQPAPQISASSVRRTRIVRPPYMCLKQFNVLHVSRRFIVTLALFVMGFSSPAIAEQDPDQRWGISIWGLSYHVDDAIDFDDANVGLGLRYYFNRLVFAEVDALRNSNGGLAVPLSAGLDLKVVSFGQRCSLYAVAAGAVVYYENRRTEREYFRAGPVPGVTLGCGRVKTNAIIVLRPSRQPVSVIVASLTILVK
jgi:hypothetical protein